MAWGAKVNSPLYSLFEPTDLKRHLRYLTDMDEPGYVVSMFPEPSDSEDEAVGLSTTLWHDLRLFELDRVAISGLLPEIPFDLDAFLSGLLT